MTVVLLDPHVVAAVAGVGVARQVDALARGRQHRWGANGDPWAMHINGCLGEFAVAEHLGLPWSAYSTNPVQLAVDVGDQRWPVQVRSTTHVGGNLLLHPTDPGPQVYVLARIKRGGLQVELAGWIWGDHAKVPERWATPQPGRSCYLVPAGDLRSLDELADYMRAAA